MKTELSKKFPPKTVLFWVMNILIFLVLNSAIIITVLSIFIDTTTTAGALDNDTKKILLNIGYKENTKIVMPFIKYLWEKDGIPWEIGALGLFSIFGIILSYFYIKFLYKIIIRKLDIKKENLSQDKELEIKKEALKMEKEKQELDILKIKAEAGLLTEKEIKKLEDRLC